MSELKRLEELNKAIEAEQRKLAEAFEALHRLHHERGDLLFLKPLREAQDD